MNLFTIFVASALVFFSQQALSADFEGKFEGLCQSSELLNLSVKETYTFNDGYFSLERDYYNEPKCLSKHSIKITYQGHYSDVQQWLPGQVYPLDMAYQEVSMVALTPKASDLLDTIDYCGIEEWEINRSYNVTANSTNIFCPLKNVPAMSYNIVLRENNTVYFGDGDKDRDDRPTELEWTKPYTIID